MSQPATRIETGAYVALVMAVGFITFHSLPDGIPILVKLTMMMITQTVLGKTLRARKRRVGI